MTLECEGNLAITSLIPLITTADFRWVSPFPLIMPCTSLLSLREQLTQIVQTK